MAKKFFKERNDSHNALDDKTLFILDIILNSLNSSIYIADMKSHEILFMNDHMKNLFGTDLTGSICWKSIHKNLKGPCEFCTNGKLINADGNPTEPHIWEFYNKKIEGWYELHDQAIPWVDGRFVRMEIAIDITDRKLVEQVMEENNEKLEQRVKERTSELKELNTALKVLLKNRENDKENIEESLLANFKLRLSPTIGRLKTNLTPKQRLSLLTLLESELEDIISPFSKRLSDPMINLTPMETQIASMIKSGKQNKEISSILNRSVNTISNHRKSIRKKLGLQNENINLRTFLSAF
ncbi:helix-turn-helix transcriptional regulator [Desulfobacula sp.]|uniref:helix-turn-helix domain-containing protein n=1 Tax=Desulfobacula sp. TaxID=2593537 RepID=UPI0025C143A3|nr:helix-turn-helix transcriptional regulator [Desulfobacula sp.]MBC2705352.1 hypothetical protein [Desulfobacula sp.]